MNRPDELALLVGEAIAIIVLVWAFAVWFLTL